MCRKFLELTRALIFNSAYSGLYKIAFRMSVYLPSKDQGVMRALVK